MPQDLIVRIVPTLDSIAPYFLERYLQTLAACRARGFDYWAISGYRDSKEQGRLFAQGRSAPGPKVTNAPPFSSLHEYGFAIDSALDKDVERSGLQPEFLDASVYAVLKEEGEARGLQVGVPSIPGGDPMHCQIPLSKIYGLKESVVLLRLKHTLKAEGLAAVWEEVRPAYEAWLVKQGIP